MHEDLAEDIEKSSARRPARLRRDVPGRALLRLDRALSLAADVHGGLIPRTNKLAFGTGVISLPNRHPAIIAGEAAQFDHMSRGRFIFGIGTGSLLSDFELLGNGDPAQRNRMLIESIDMIEKIWSQDPPYDITGEFWSTQDRAHGQPLKSASASCRNPISNRARRSASPRRAPIRRPCASPANAAGGRSRAGS